MDEIKGIVNHLGTAILPSLLPIQDLLGPLLIKNKDQILSVPSTSHKYGPHPRNELDVYTSTSHEQPSPILIWLYGGGLVAGDKTDTSFADGLTFHNLGAFFAQRGFTVVIPDYRRVDSIDPVTHKPTGEGAVYPSGGEDLSLALTWVEHNLCKDKSVDVFIMGHSAGGTHLATFLLDPAFAAQRNRLVSGASPLRLRGAIPASAPFTWDTMNLERTPVITTYFGDMRDKLRDRTAQHQLEVFGTTRVANQDVQPKWLIVEAEWDPRNEVLDSGDKFYATAKKVIPDQVEYLELKGHNHLSYPWSLMVGQAEDQWGVQIIAWMRKTLGQ
ncbi:hypothetical protein VHEMI08383 [[Torrubiella] hemipterigena]|uniref:BD-FAE-like domain-containing protein n=1 Tax=[Torrubiella] hemipterigena TaxID=1531966 RepID=A0A0A1TN46_9HYPO|nr:hypothetical protein VHEMI08383 [[Torrubiella] hemipterigena]